MLLAAVHESQTDVDAWVDRVNQPISRPTVQAAGNTDGDLYGEVVVFTGTLDLPRSEASTLAASIGCQVEDSVTKHTTILVLGDQDSWKLGGYEKSSKHRKAEQLAAKGLPIRIILEADFKSLVKNARLGKSDHA